MKKFFVAVVFILFTVVVNATSTKFDSYLDNDIGISQCDFEQVENFNFVSYSDNLVAEGQVALPLKYPILESTITYNNNNFEYQVNVTSAQSNNYENWSVVNNLYACNSPEKTNFAKSEYDYIYYRKIIVNNSNQGSGIFRLDIGE